MSRLTRKAVFRSAVVLIILGILMVLVTLTKPSAFSMTTATLLIGVAMIAIADRVDPTPGDIGEKTLQRRALHRPAGIARVIVKLRQNAPALVPLALDVGFARLALGVEGVELLFEPFLRGFAGVDGAADLLTADGIGGRLPSRLVR